MLYLFLNAYHLRLSGILTKLGGAGGNRICGGTTIGGLRNLNGISAAAGSLDLQEGGWNWGLLWCPHCGEYDGTAHNTVKNLPIMPPTNIITLGINAAVFMGMFVWQLQWQCFLYPSIVANYFWWVGFYSRYKGLHLIHQCNTVLFFSYQLIHFYF